jgi:Sulfotransferase domain
MIQTYRRLRYRAMRTKLRAPLAWILHRSLTSKDVFIASFPRSGSHWLKFQLLEILTGQEARFENIKKLMPKVGDHGVPGAAILEAMQIILPAEPLRMVPGGGRLIHTHEPYRKEYKKAIYLVRDVRDVALSEYAQQKEMNALSHYDLTDFDDYLAPFLTGRIERFGNWQRHVTSWLDSPLARKGNLLVIRFEDLRRSTEPLLVKIIEFLGASSDREVIRCAIANNTLERMRAKEDTTSALHRSMSEEGRFVRRGAVGGWRERLTNHQINLIERHTGNTLVRLGYPVSHDVKRADDPGQNAKQVPYQHVV